MKDQEYIASASQTVGPFFHFALTANMALGRMAGPHARGEHIHLTVRLLDGDGAPVEDGMIELWQADANGKYRHPEDPREMPSDMGLCGFGRMATNGDGRCVFETVRPGRVPASNGSQQAPHINVIVLARGLLLPLFTRIYFDGDPANTEDPALAHVREPRRATLLAHPHPNRPGDWNFDIHLAGECETVFFDL